MKISPARSAAFDVLLAIERERSFSSVLLPAVETTLSNEDRGLCHRLVLGTLRKQIYLDRVISILSAGRKIDVEVRIALRLGIFQLKFLDRVPAYSAVNESVNLVNRAKKSSARTFVNALLRRSVREDVDIEFTDDIDRASVETSHPRWLLEKWMGDVGPQTARALADANNIQPPTAFRVLSADPELIREVFSFAESSKYVPGCYISRGSDASLHRLAREKKIYLQDEGSQMVANALEIGPRDKVLDVCAAPGGKTGIIARAALKKRAMVVAGDLTSRRVRLLTKNSDMQGLKLSGIVQFDAAARLPFGPRSFDSVLVDAPCSGTGTIGHNPELRYLVEPPDFLRFASKQLAILISASELVRPGGQLIYSTCSLEREENEEVCERFLGKIRDFHIVEPRVPDVFLTPQGFARTRPDRDGMDGFFIAAFRRS